jgi:preprotein translocase subunit Sec63
VLGRHERVREGDYFACLGAAPGDSPHELQRAYDRARQQFDPANLNPAVTRQYAAELTEIREVIEEAYRVLADEPLRQAYCEHVLGSASTGEPT